MRNLLFNVEHREGQNEVVFSCNWVCARVLDHVYKFIKLYCWFPIWKLLELRSLARLQLRRRWLLQAQISAHHSLLETHGLWNLLLHYLRASKTWGLVARTDHAFLDFYIGWVNFWAQLLVFGAFRCLLWQQVRSDLSFPLVALRVAQVARNRLFNRALVWGLLLGPQLPRLVIGMEVLELVKELVDLSDLDLALVVLVENSKDWLVLLLVHSEVLLHLQGWRMQ